MFALKIASSWYSTWLSEILLSSTGKCLSERQNESKKRHCRISGGAHYQLHGKWIQPVFTALLLPPGMEFSIRWSSPQQGEAVPPCWKLLDAFPKAVGCKIGPQWALITCYFPWNPPSSMDFPPFFSSNVPFIQLSPPRYRLSPNGCWERSRMEQAALSLSPSLSRSFLHPPSYMHPPCLSLHLPTLSFLLSSSPLSYTHTHTDMHFSSPGFSQLLLCHSQPCQTERFTAYAP